MSKKVIFVDFRSEKRAKTTILAPKTRFFSIFALKRGLFTLWTALVDRLVILWSITLFHVFYSILLSVLYVYVHIVVYYRVYIREKKLYS
jgi:uncharacterized membrane protein YagU involved in acid resistance